MTDEKIKETVTQIVQIFRERKEAVPPQVRHALSAVNGNATIKGKPERVGVARVLSLIEKNRLSKYFDVKIEITKK